MAFGPRWRRACAIGLLTALTLSTGRVPVGARPVGQSGAMREGWSRVAVWASQPLPLPPTAFQDPTGITVDPFDDTVLVVDTGNDRVQVFGRDGGYVGTIGAPGPAPEGLSRPRGAAISGGRVFVADTGNDRVAVFSSDGVYRSEWPGLAAPWGVATSVDGRTVFVSENRASQIAIFTASGARTGTWGRFGGGDLLNRPEGLNVLSDGRLVVANTGNQRLTVFDPTGVQIDSTGALTASPHDVVAGAAGTVWSTETGAPMRTDAVVGRDTTPGLPVRGLRLDAPGAAGVTVAADGTVLATVRDDARPLHGVRLWRGTQLQDEWGTVPAPLGLFDHPALIAGRTAAIVVDRWRRAQRIGLDGRPIDQLPIGQVNDVAATTDGVVVVRDTRVERLGADGALIWRTNLPLTVDAPWARAVDVDGTTGAVTVIDVGRQRFERFAADGTPAGETTFQPGPGAFAALWDLAPAGPSSWWTVNRSAGTLERRRRDRLTVEAAWTVPGQPLRVASSEDGDAFVLNRYGWIWRYRADGTLAAVWHAALLGDESSSPVDLTVDALGRVLVADGGRDEVTVWSPDPALSPPDVPTFEPNCTPNGDKRADPTRLVLGEATWVTLHVDGTCPATRAANDIVLVLDVSGSMVGAKLDAAKAAVTAFLGAIDVVDAHVALVAFNQDATLEVGLTPNPAAIQAATAGLQAGGGTDIARAIDAARRELTGPRRRAIANGVVILLTDGGSDPITSMREAQLTKLEGARIFTIGFGDGVNEPLLRDIASAPSDYAFAPGAEQLAAIYRGIAQRLAATVLFRSLTIVDEVPADMRYVVDSANPPAEFDGTALVWRLADVPLAGIDLRYELEPTITGIRPTNVVAIGEGIDGLGARGRIVFPVPSVEVIAPTASPTVVPGITPSATPIPTRTPTFAPTPTPTATRPPRPIYLPLAVDEHCEKGLSPLAVVLVLDTSSSMSALTRAGRTKLDAAVDAARALLDRLDLQASDGGAPSRDRASIVSFDSAARVDESFTAVRGPLDLALDRLRQGNGTRIDLGLAAAAAELLGVPDEPNLVRAAIVLTDGRPTGTTDEAVVTAADGLKATGAVVYTIGLGDDVDAALLERVATGAAQRLLAPDAEDLARIYRDIARELPCARRR
ncbi:MAG: VWA domain-containing protein [Ardenticatenales bacterium]